MTTTIEDDGLNLDQLIGDNMIGGTDDFPAINRAGLIGDLRAALRSSPAVDGVRVKPLVWRELTADRGDGAREPNGDWEAETPLGFYEIEMIWVGEIAVWGLTYGTGNGYIGGDWHSPDDAKAAAQADYETRVRSALSPTSDRASVVEAVAAAKAYNDEHGDPADTLHHDRSLIEIFERALSQRSS